MKTFSFYIGSLLLMALTVLYVSCKKEYSYEGGPMGGLSGGTAVYTLVGAGGNCTGPVINGSYVAGNAIRSSNNILLQVDVTTIGTYAVSTNISNGVQFSAAGNFTVTGIQTIKLIGSGIPVSAGTFPYNPPIGLGCTFFVTFSAPGEQTATFKLEGDPGSCSNFVSNGTYASGISLIGNNTAEVYVNVTSVGAYSINTDTLDGISFSKSGKFTATGIQKVILQGTGTPSYPDNLVFTPSSGNTGCSFGVTVTTPQPPATYVLESNLDASCTGYSVSGNFYTGTALTSTNTMAVKVTVTVLGNFSIRTNTINGMTFSYTGAFTTLGHQIVVLTGSGTPAASGTFSFVPQIIGPHPIGGETCTADVVVM
jgi:hypothetical protein